MKRFIKLIIMLFITIIAIPSVMAKTSDISFKLKSVTSIPGYSLVSIDIKNNTSTDYTLGWVDSSVIEVVGSEGARKLNLTSQDIPKNSTVELRFFTDNLGKIEKIKISDIRALNSMGLPDMSMKGLTFSVDVSEYNEINALPYLIGAVIIVIAIIILIAILIKSKNHRLAGYVSIALMVVGLILIGFGLYKLATMFINFAPSEGYIIDMVMSFLFFFVGGILIGTANHLKALNKRAALNTNTTDNTISGSAIVEEDDPRRKRSFKRLKAYRNEDKYNSDSKEDSFFDDLDNKKF